MRNLPASSPIFLLLFAMILSGCGLFPSSLPQPTGTAPPAATFPVLPAHTSVPPTETPQPIRPACIPDIEPAELSAESYEAFPQAVQAYLNAGGSPVALSGLVNQAGAGAQPVTTAIADFTGDGRDDVAVAFADGASPGPSVDGRLVVYVCHLASYEIGLNIRTGQEFFRGFHIWFWQDLDQAGGKELVVSQGLCGAHTCFEDLRVLGWDGASFVDRLEGSTADLPFPQVGVTDADGDGNYQVEVSSGGFGSVGAGPQRPVTWIWRLKPPGNAWQPDEERPDPSPYRIHVLHDADDASQRGAYDLARQLYRRVIEKEGLDDWIIEDGYVTLAAYARYRLAVIAISLGESAEADAAVAEMEALYPSGDPLHDYVEMAILFQNAFSGSGLAAACTGAAGFAESHTGSILDPLGSQVYGYANRDYTGGSMCPGPVAAP